VKRLTRALLKYPHPTVKGEYVHWDKLRHLDPPKGMSREDWWIAIRAYRQPLLKPLPLKDKEGRNFQLAVPDEEQKLLHDITVQATSPLESPLPGKDERDSAILRSLMEEAITSSRLEGASTARAVAKELLRTGRRPRDRSERMIVNNYQAMRRIRELKDRELTPDLLLELHRTLTDATLDTEEDAGRFRSESDNIRVEDRETGEVVHVPPPASQLPARLKKMFEFANGGEGGSFIHPAVRAIVLHFWLAYERPFVDGNGRCARTLFYWSMIRQKYGLAEFLSISRLILKAPAQYARVFLYTETDSNDLTYFLTWHLGVLAKALKDLRQDVARRAKENQQLVASSRVLRELNHRQRASVAEALRNPSVEFTFEAIRRTHDVVYQTARNDLFNLVKRGLFEKAKRSRSLVFFAAPSLRKRIEGSGE
jgi:Fic family protein